jgi:transcriptional regulator with XRE-family HTH domain
MCALRAFVPPPRTLEHATVQQQRLTMKRKCTKKNSSTTPPVSSASLPDRIRHARARAGLTKTGLAHRVGVCASAVVQWEHPDGTVPNATNLARVAQVTDVAFEWLATGRGPHRVKVGDGPPALDPTAIAVTLFEERLLQLARRLPSHRRDPLIEFLSAWTKKD